MFGWRAGPPLHISPRPAVIRSSLERLKSQQLPFHQRSSPFVATCRQVRILLGACWELPEDIAMKRHLDHATCNTKPGAKLQKLRDGGGRFLHIETSGTRGWRFYYRRPISKKQNTISFGAFPEVSLAE